MPDSARIASELTVQAALRQWYAKGGIATLLHKGDAWGGAILVKLNYLDGTFQILTQIRDMEGRLSWLKIENGKKLSAIEADSYIDRRIKSDPDLWVVEIEGRDGSHPFEGRTL